MSEWKIEPLAPHHARSTFECGNNSLNTWIRQYASQDVKKGLCRAYILVRPPQALVIGFYCISSSLIVHEHLPPDQRKKYSPRLEIPAMLLGRLAVDESHQGQGLGDLLLYNALARVQRLADETGVVAVTVHAIDETARNYYVHRDFIPFLDDQLHLFYPVGEIRKLGLPSPG